MKRILLILMVGFIVPTGLSAQKVYKVDNGDGTNTVILDMTVAAGMPEGAVRTTKETWPPSPPTYNPDENGENGRLNEKVYQKLEISKNDPGTMNWADAWTYCQDLNEGGTGWRLPTQRELQMMWIFKRALEGVGLTSFSAADYWSATESFVSYAWYVNFSTGHTYIYETFYGYRVRCVREL